VATASTLIAKVHHAVASVLVSEHPIL